MGSALAWLAIKNKSTNSIMEPKVELANGVVFVDRIPKLQRVKMDGKAVYKGSVGGGQNWLRIKKGERGYFLVSSCVSTQLLLANIYQWPSDVSADGHTITLWLIDHSQGRSAYKRKYLVTFFDETACEKFFDVYTQCLPDDAEAGPSFTDMLYSCSEHGQEDKQEQDKQEDEQGDEQGETEEDDNNAT